MKKFFKVILIIFFSSCFLFQKVYSAEKQKLLEVDWSFKGYFGKFDRASLQRGYQVYNEVCASCHSMKYLSYRNLAEKGGPEFSKEEAKAIAANFEVTDGPNDDGEMFTRPAKLSDKFVNPYQNDKEATASNGGAYPPDMSVLVKARSGGANYIYSVLLGYEDPPNGVTLDDGVYYNKYMYGNNIKMPKVLEDDLVVYNDGTIASEEQMAKDVVTFLAWAAEPHLEARHRIGFKAIIYLIILSFLAYFSMKRLWSRIESKI
jgi:ubiquinol-cytochrome c reductase cytochrome c1 subunit|tara:strand:- start:153 stop:935 length:783 start_codon:yes stop_codon:yes gene_type:complete